MIKSWPHACEHLITVEPKFDFIIKQLGDKKITLQPFHSLFYALARSIIYQQLSTKAASSIFEKFVALFPNRRSITAKNLLHISDQQLRSAGLSHRKLDYIRGLSFATLNKQLPGKTALNQMSDQDIIEQLTQLKGIGIWTVQMLLIFYLNRIDIMPSLDLGVRQGYALIMDIPSPPDAKQLDSLTKHWAPYRSVASWYCWRMVDHSRMPSQP